ncbi:MAG: formimidoylglutamate deiminase, partial [Rhizobiaceae bacterium]|nr:formimidoylglutamate deiminase [Rhizobiaceae bacterium]
HDRDGRRYDNIAEMSERIAAAASETGIELTLLPSFYAHSTFGGAAPGDRQRRFVNDLDGYALLLDGCRAAMSAMPGAAIGVAPHSLRAVTAAELATVATLAPDGPVHIHAAEQRREVEDCLAWSGARPVEWLLANAGLDERWCVIHATHMTEAETHDLASSGATVGLCPITEASLGDGTFPGPSFIGYGGKFGIGSDSNVLIGVADELRQLEYSQRLRHRARNLMAPPNGSTGRALVDGALAGGAALTGASELGLQAGAPANLLSLDAGHPALVSRSGDAILDAWIFASRDRDIVDCVWIRGEKRVEGGRHLQRRRISDRFRAAMEALLAA